MESELGGVEGCEGVVDLEAMPQHVAPVDDLDVVALRLGRQEERVGQGLVLEQEAVVGRDEDVGGVGAGQLLHEVDDVAQRVLDGLEDLPFGAGLVAGGVDPVVVDVQDPIGLVELPPLVGVQGLEVLGLDRRAADALKDLPAEGGAVGRLVVREHGLGISGVLERRVREQSCHPELRVARQHPEDGVKRGVEAVLLPDARAELVGHLVPERVGDDDDGLLVAVPHQRLHIAGVEGRLRAEHGRAPPVDLVHLLLPRVAQLVDELVGVALLDLLPQRLQRLRVLGRARGVDELPVELVDAEPLTAVALQPVVERLHREIQRGRVRASSSEALAMAV